MRHDANLHTLFAEGTDSSKGMFVIPVSQQYLHALSPRFMHFHQDLRR